MVPTIRKRRKREHSVPVTFSPRLEDAIDAKVTKLFIGLTSYWKWKFIGPALV